MGQRLRSAFRFTFYVLLFALGILVWCEFLLYYVYLGATCTWPSSSDDSTTINALVLSDTHLLGRIRGHWFDKLRREWQMYRSFQSALALFSPSVVFVLGDIFDEGQWASPGDFDRYVTRFRSLFAVPPSCELHAVVGNHDIGFHYRTNEYLSGRFDHAMNTSTVDYIKFLDSIYFVRLNSMAMENDGCTLCNEAMFGIEKLARHFRDLRRRQGGDEVYPILLTHFPLFRADESVCTEQDSSPPGERNVPHREGIDCFSRDATEYLLDRLKPRLILNGHVHHSCRVNHTVTLYNGRDKRVIPEWTVASFSWRNKADPSFLLLKVTNSSHTIRKCFLPNEQLVIGTYVAAAGCLVGFLLLRLAFCIIKRKRD